MLRNLTFILNLMGQIYCCKSALISDLVYALKDCPKGLKLVGIYLGLPSVSGLMK